MALFWKLCWKEKIFIWQLCTKFRGGSVIAKKSFRYSKQIFCVISLATLVQITLNFDYFGKNLTINNLLFLKDLNFPPKYLFRFLFDSDWLILQESGEKFVTWIGVRVHVHDLWYFDSSTFNYWNYVNLKGKDVAWNREQWSEYM